MAFYGGHKARRTLGEVPLKDIPVPTHPTRVVSYLPRVLQSRRPIGQDFNGRMDSELSAEYPTSHGHSQRVYSTGP